MRVLVVEDDRALSSLLSRSLRAEDITVACAHDGEAGIELFLAGEPDLLILDLDLPARPGMEVLAFVRTLSPFCPVLVLSGRAETPVRISCLEMGADDCMLKPFSLQEFRARCHAMLRRHGAAQARRDAAQSSERSGTLELGSLRMERVRRQVEFEGERLHLTKLEFCLLEQLLLGRGAPVARASLRQEVWADLTVEANTLDVHVASLRRKLHAKSGAPQIETLRGIGYRLAPPAVPCAGAPMLASRPREYADA